MMTAPIENSTQCPLCGQPAYHPFLELRDVPMDGMLWNSQTEALSAPAGDIHLAYCPDCTYIGNLLFEPAKIRYDQDYSFSLHNSPTYRAFVQDVATRLVTMYQLRDKTVLEIACGQGDFLRLICTLGGNQGIGVDPSTTSRVEQVGGSQITFQQALFGPEYAQTDFDFVACRHALEVMADPRRFIDMLRQTIGERGNVIVYFEVPDAVHIFRDLTIRNILYDNKSWFTSRSISKLFELSGFKILSVMPCFQDGQYLGIEAMPAPEQTTSTFASDFDHEAFTRTISDFAESYRHKIESWGKRWAELKLHDRSVVAWGAGAGAVNFFSSLGIHNEIAYVVDINPSRQGKYLPRTGQQVISPEFLHTYPVDVIIITNSTYEKEIRQQVADLGLTCDFWVL